MLRTMEFDLGPICRRRRELSVTVEGQPAGRVDLGVADVDDLDDPKVRLDFVAVHEPFRGTEVSLELLRRVQTIWPLARIVGGPSSEDEERGPRFRLKCWDAGIEVHEPNCRPGSCQCRALIVDEVTKRYQEWFENGGLTSGQLKKKLALLSVKPA